ncbi:hypothetical protein DRO33_06585 [Candidatus Bathyarchaeota archaeon]|nr:MAG: hypothetical protein DRO33_06585 [Candidatus Bathyarchaeota archaeon]
MCKYEAIKVEDFERKIDVGKCSGCGVCTSSCPSLALTLKYLPHKMVVARVKALLRTARLKEPFEPRALVFACDWASRRGADLGLIRKVPASSNVRATKLTCMGALDPLFVVEAFLAGADGVLAVGCAGEDCNFLGSNLVTEAKAKWIERLLAMAGLEPSRFKLVLLPLAEAREKFLAVLSDFISGLKELGPSPASGPSPDQKLRDRLEAVKKALSVFRLRVLLGCERYLLEAGNAYGEVPDPGELRAVINEALTAEFERARILLALREPKSVRELANELGMEANKVLRHVVVLRARRQVELYTIEGTSPRYKVAGEV